MDPGSSTRAVLTPNLGVVSPALPLRLVCLFGFEHVTIYPSLNLHTGHSEEETYRGYG